MSNKAHKIAAIMGRADSYRTMPEQEDAHEFLQDVACDNEPKFTPSKEVHRALTDQQHRVHSDKQARKDTQARYQMVWDMYTKVGVEGFALLDDELIRDVWHAYNQAGYNNYPVAVALKAELLRRGVSV